MKVQFKVVGIGDGRVYVDLRYADYVFERSVEVGGIVEVSVSSAAIVSAYPLDKVNEALERHLEKPKIEKAIDTFDQLARDLEDVNAERARGFRDAADKLREL